MNILKQAFAVSLLAFIVGLAVNFIRYDGISLFPSQSTYLFNEDQITQISTAQAQDFLKDKETFFIDLRPIDSFSLSHIPGSLSFPAEKIYGMLASFSEQIPLKAKIVLYGADAEDTSPSEAASLLQMMGYSSIYIMTQGWDGWEHKKENL
jgi:rhodanese-related sulfurtransferase